MRNIFVPFLLSVIFSCGNNQAEKLKKENELLKQEAILKDSANKNFIRSFGRIVNNLNFISETEKTIVLKIKANRKPTKNDKSKIAEEIEKINLLMQENKSIVNILNDNLKISKRDMIEFGKMVESLNCQMDEKNLQINSLKKSLSDTDISFNTFDFMLDTLTTLNSGMEKKIMQQQRIIENQQNLLSTAYYILGTSKELRDGKVISKAAIGRSEKLLDNFDVSKFVKIDMRTTNTIDVWSEKFYIITNHPASAYKIAKKGKRSFLTITNPNEFWKVTKYLVIVKE